MQAHQLGSVISHNILPATTHDPSPYGTTRHLGCSDVQGKFDDCICDVLCICGDKSLGGPMVSCYDVSLGSAVVDTGLQ